MSVYAFICWTCDHRVVLHTSKDRGPYRCQLCTCEITADSPTRSLSKREYEKYQLTHPEDRGEVTA